MTPFAVTQRAARLAPELDKLVTYHVDPDTDTERADPWTTEMVLRALYAAGLTLDAELNQPSYVKSALDKLELSG